MRAGTWSTFRDIAAAQVSWRRARDVADRLPDDDPDRAAMRIAPRTLLCGSAWRVGGSGADTGFDELRDLCTAAGDQRSLAIGMTGQVMAHFMNARRRESSRLATEHAALLGSIGDPTLMVGLSFAAIAAKCETGEMVEVLRLAQRVIDLAGGDPTAGNLILGSPLAFALAYRGAARWCLGIPGWRDDFAQAVSMARAADPFSLAGVMYYIYPLAIPGGHCCPMRPPCLRPPMRWRSRSAQVTKSRCTLPDSLEVSPWSISMVRSVTLGSPCLRGSVKPPYNSGSLCRLCRSSTSTSPIVPMFHANAWGLPYVALMAGAAPKTSSNPGASGSRRSSSRTASWTTRMLPRRLWSAFPMNGGRNGRWPLWLSSRTHMSPPPTSVRT
jgi:hypothetical protein